MQMRTPAFNIPHLASAEQQLLKHKMGILSSEHLAMRVRRTVTSLLSSVSPLSLSSRVLLAGERCVPATVGSGRCSMLSENIALTALCCLKRRVVYSGWNTALWRQRARSYPQGYLATGLHHQQSFKMGRATSAHLGEFPDDSLVLTLSSCS